MVMLASPSPRPETRSYTLVPINEEPQPLKSLKLGPTQGFSICKDNWGNDLAQFMLEATGFGG